VRWGKREGGGERGDAQIVGNGMEEGRKEGKKERRRESSKDWGDAMNGECRVEILTVRGDDSVTERTSRWGRRPILQALTFHIPKTYSSTPSHNSLKMSLKRHPNKRFTSTS